MLREINRKSDFDFILSLLGSDSKPLGWQEANWQLSLYADVANGKNFAYKAAYAFGECRNCRKSDDGQIEILVDSHEFPVGELLMDFEVEIPDERYPDRNRSITIPAIKTGIKLVDDRGLASVSGLEIPVSVPAIKAKEEEAPAEDPKTDKPEGPPEDEEPQEGE